MREKYISSAQFVYFLREVCSFFNFGMIELKSKHTSLKKIEKLSKTNIFFSHFEGTRGEKKPQIFRTLVELFLMDSSGNEMYHEILKDVWKQANLIVAVYDVTREESFGNVSKASAIVIRQLRPGFKFPAKIEMDDLTNYSSF